MQIILLLSTSHHITYPPCPLHQRTVVSRACAKTRLGKLPIYRDSFGDKTIGRVKNEMETLYFCFLFGTWWKHTSCWNIWKLFFSSSDFRIVAWKSVNQLDGNLANESTASWWKRSIPYLQTMQSVRFREQLELRQLPDKPYSFIFGFNVDLVLLPDLQSNTASILYWHLLQNCLFSSVQVLF